MFQIGGLDLSPACVRLLTGNGDPCPMMGCQICDISSPATIASPPFFPCWRGTQRVLFSSKPSFEWPRLRSANPQTYLHFSWLYRSKKVG